QLLGDGVGFDNFHQSADPVKIIEPPGGDPLHRIFGGCPDCVHIHWRWGAIPASTAERLGRGNFSSGKLIGILPGSNQDLDIGTVLYKDSKIHTVSFESTKPPGPGGREPLRAFQLPNNTKNDFHNPYDVVFWYIGTGHQPHDEFFNHGGFFNPALGLNVSKTVQLNSSGAQSATTADGPTSVIFGYLYQEGSVIFGELNPATLPPLPAGYSALNNKAYSVTTDTVFSGQETVTFSAGSVSDPAVFSNLRILHTEVDPFDPEATIWVDRTILAPDPQAPNYGTRTINAAVSALGNFLIAIQSPNTNTSSA